MCPPPGNMAACTLCPVIGYIFAGSVFINTGRSNVVAESDLLEALDKGWIREAILDVFDKEPLPSGHPFW